MDRAVEYRKTASACLQMAGRCEEPEQKARWLRIRILLDNLALKSRMTPRDFLHSKMLT